MPLKEWYKTQVNSNKLLCDSKQLEVIEKLNIFVNSFNKLNASPKNIITEILNFIPNTLPQIFNTISKYKYLKYLRYLKIFNKNNGSKYNHHNITSMGYYIYGNFGGGKTMIMNQLYQSIATHKKVRLHFHKFMDIVQKQLNDLKSNNDSPLENIAKNYKIIFLDEMHVNDITNAMILNNLLSNLLKKGIYIVISSNYLPDNLYKEGLMRERFIPAINFIKNHLTILELNTEYDYRKIINNQTIDFVKNPIFIFNQVKNNCTDKLNNIFEYFLSQKVNQRQQELIDKIQKITNQSNSEIKIQSRQLKFIRCNGVTIWFDFNIICGNKRSQLDYLELSEYFDYFIIQGIHKLNEDDKNIARRFTWLVDILYDNKIKLAISSETPLENIYTIGELSNEFKRTVSRLLEMQSIQYINATPTRIN